MRLQLKEHWFFNVEEMEWRSTSISQPYTTCRCVDRSCGNRQVWLVGINDPQPDEVFIT